MAPALDTGLVAEHQGHRHLVTRDDAGAAAIGGSHPLSIISIAMVSAGAGALALSVVIVSVYFFHVRRNKNRRKSLAEKVGEPVLLHAPQHVDNAADLTQMTPAMRLAHSTRAMDFDAAQRQEAARVAASQWQVPMPSATMSARNSFNDVVMPGPSPRSSSEHSRPSISSNRPPMPEDSQFRIQLARQKSLQKSIHSSKSVKSTKSITIVEPSKPSKAANAPNANPVSMPGSSSSASTKNVNGMPRIPAPVQLPPIMTTSPFQTTTMYMPERSLSPMPAPSEHGSEALTPILDLGMEFGQSHSHDRSSTSDLDPHSWLTSALDSAFNAADGDVSQSFNQPPRKAPQIPSTSTNNGSAAMSKPKSVTRTTKPPPPPASGPPQKYENPTTGGAARVTVNYVSPYQRRTLHESEQEAVEVVESPRVTQDEYAQRPGEQSTERTSMESAIRAAALFNFMEPALRSSSDHDRSPATLMRRGDSAVGDLAGDSTILSNVSAYSTLSFSAPNAADLTGATSIGDEGRSRRSSEDEKRIPIMAVDQISPIVQTDLPLFTSTTVFPPTLVIPRIATPDGNMLGPQSVSMQREENLSNVTLVNEGEPGGVAQIAPSKSGFASSLRARFTMTRSKSNMSTSSKSSSPVWSQKSPTFAAAATFLQHGNVSPALSMATKESAMTPNSFAFGPPTMTWNVSTEDVDLPHFVPPASLEEQVRSASALSVEHASVGLGLTRGSEDHASSPAVERKAEQSAEQRQSPLPTVKPLKIKRTSNSLERKRSNSSHASSSRHSHDRHRAFPWSRTTGGPASLQGHGSTLAGHDADGRSSPRFADADSPTGSPSMRAVAIPSSAGHASQGHADPDEQGHWSIGRPATVRDSVASSYCDTIASSVSENHDQPFDYQNAQSQRAKLLESVQKRQQAKQQSVNGKDASRGQSVSGAPGGFTSHSATLSIGDRSDPKTVLRQVDGNKLKSKGPTALDVNVGAPFLGGMGDGILTPPLTPFEKTIALPDIGAVVPTLSEDAKVAIVPSHARIQPSSHQQKASQSPTAEQRREERLSKLRPLSLAASHAAAPRVPPPLHIAHRSNASSRTSSAFQAGGAITTSSSYASMAGSNTSSRSSQHLQHPSSSPTRSIIAPFHYNTMSNKRSSRASSTAGSAMNHGPMGMVNTAGLSTSVSPNIGVLPASSHPSFLPSPSPNATPRLFAPAGAMASTRAKSSTMATPQAQQWLSAQMATSSTDSTFSPSGATVARLSGSSYASHTSILAKFPDAGLMAAAANSSFD